MKLGDGIINRRRYGSSDEDLETQEELIRSRWRRWFRFVVSVVDMSRTGDATLIPWSRCDR
jgi:hypothetical protein